MTLNLLDKISAAMQRERPQRNKERHFNKHAAILALSNFWYT